MFRNNLCLSELNDFNGAQKVRLCAAAAFSECMVVPQALDLIL